MQEPSKQEVLDYVADMAEQLAVMCREDDRLLSAILRGAAQFARNQDQPEQIR